MNEISAIILAGGASRRFPGGKLQQEIQGLPMLAHVHRLATQLASQIVIVGEQQIIPPDQITSCLADGRPGDGPLAALHTGLKAVSNTTALLLAGDMPGLTLEALQKLQSHFMEKSTHICCFRTTNRLHPMPSIMEVSSLIQVEQLLEQGMGSLMALFDTLSVNTIDMADPGILQDIDTPEDLERMRENH